MDIQVDEAPYFEDRSTMVIKGVSTGSTKENNHTDNPDPFILAESLVMTGSGRAVVCAVGHSKYLFEIKEENSLVGIGAPGEDNLTPL